MASTPSEPSPDSVPSPPPRGPARSWLSAFVRRGLQPGRGDVIAAEVGAEARGVAVGKNIIQIGALQLPTLVVVALLVFVLSGVVGIYWIAFNTAPRPPLAPTPLPAATSTIQLVPEDAWAYIKSGNDYYWQGQYEEAIRDYTRAIALDSDNASAYYNRGRAYAGHRKYKEAIEDYTRAIALDPRNASAYRFRGLAYNRQRQYEEAIPDFTRAIQVNPNYAAAYYNRGYAYYVQGRYEEAIPDFTRALQLAPDNAGTYNDRLCRTYALLSQPDKALDYCNRAIELNRSSPNSYDSRGVVYALLGEFPAAIADLQVYVNKLEKSGNPSESTYLELEKRRRWIEDLEAGINPFTSEVLEGWRAE